MTLLFGRQEQRLFTLDREPMTDQGVDVPKVHIGKPVNFIEVLYRNVGKSDLQAQKCLKDSCTTKAHCIMMTAHQSWEAGAHCTDSRHSNRLENISVMPVGLSLFQEAHLVLVPSSIPAVPCFLWATRLRVAFRSLCCFSLL